MNSRSHHLDYRLAVLGLLVALAVLIRTPEARAETISYEAPAGCGSAEALLASIEKRLPGRNWQLGEDGVLTIVLERRGNEVVASLTILLEDDRSLRRSLDAGSCDEAVEAIAFVTALALDSTGDLLLRGAPPSEPGAPVRTAEEEPRGEAPRGRVGWSVGALVLARFGPAPKPLVGGGIDLALAAQRPGLWAPMVRLGLTGQARGGFEQPAGTASFSGWNASVDFCPSHAMAGPLSIRPCLTATAGALIAEGSETYQPERAVRPWVSVGGSVLAGVEVVRHFEVGVIGSVETPLIRDSFAFDGEVFHQVDGLSGTIGGRFALSF